MGKERNAGVDLLRITSMFLVVLLHILGQGALPADPFTAQYFAGWFLYAGAYCAVNCYALITGYVMFESKFRISRLISLWFEVLFYAVIITLGFWVLRPQTVGGSELLSMFFPVSNQYYWYFTAYCAMYFFVPVLNLAVEKLSRSQLRMLLAAIFVLFTVLPSVMQTDLFQTYNGYSPVWLMVMYFIGAYLKKYGIPNPQKRIWYLGVYLVCSMLVWGSRALGDWLISLGFDNINSNMMFNYTSPLIFGAGIGLFLFFASLRIRSPFALRCIGFFAPLSFGVYLIHTHPLVWWHWLPARFVRFAGLYLPLYLGAIFLAALALYAVCSLADYLRALLFRVCRIHRLSEKLESLLLRALGRLSDRDDAAPAAKNPAAPTSAAAPCPAELPQLP